MPEAANTEIKKSIARKQVEMLCKRRGLKGYIVRHYTDDRSASNPSIRVINTAPNALRHQKNRARKKRWRFSKILVEYWDVVTRQGDDYILRTNLAKDDHQYLMIDAAKFHARGLMNIKPGDRIRVGFDNKWQRPVYSLEKSIELDPSMFDHFGEELLKYSK